MLGGFIWEWCDEGLRKTTKDGTKFIAYGGDFGDEPNLGAFCIKGVVTSDRDIFPKCWKVKKVHQPIAISAIGLKPGKVTLKSKKPEFIPQPDELRGALDLAAKRHYHELQPRAEVILSLDAKMSGLGNGSCGPGVLAKYAVPPTNYSLSLRLSPVTR